MILCLNDHFSSVEVMAKIAAVVIPVTFLLLTMLHSCRGDNSSVSSNSVVQDVTLFYHVKYWMKIKLRMPPQSFNCVDGFVFLQAAPKDAFEIVGKNGELPITIVFLHHVWNVTLSKTNNTLYFMHPTVINRFVKYCLEDDKNVAMIYAKEHLGEASKTFKTAVESQLKAKFGDIKKV